MIFVPIWILVFSSVTLTTARSVMLSLGVVMLLLWLSELVSVVLAYIWAENKYLNSCHKCVLFFLMRIWDVFFTDTVHSKLYCFSSSNRRTTFPFLHGQTETGEPWAGYLQSSVIPSCCGTLLITCVLVWIWYFCCFSPLVLHFWAL